MARLPEPAKLEWKEDGTPVATSFDDVYFSLSDGLEETRAVFLKACGLPEGWQCVPSYTIAELGFGTGLNFLATVEAWLKSTTGQNNWLHFTSVEKHPMSPQDAARALARWPDLEILAAELIAQWPVPALGPHRLVFPDWRVTLTLFIGDAEDWLSTMDFQADAWFLDGFAPAKNDTMWAEALYPLMARHSKKGTRIGTYTVAGAVRRGLAAAGFTVAKAPGFGRKRERLEASWPGTEETGEPDLPLMRPTPQKIDRLVVIGAGIAGASVARSFALRGLPVDVLDQAQAPAQGASGNPIGLVMPRLDAADTPQARLLLHTYLFARRFYTQHGGSLAMRVDVEQAAQSEKDVQRFEKLLADPPLPDTALTGTKTGMNVTLTHHDAMMVRPNLLVSELLDHPNISFHGGAQIDDLADLTGRYPENTMFIVTSGLASQSLLSDMDIPMAGRLGQVDWSDQLPEADENRAFASGHYALRTGTSLLFGATFEAIAVDQIPETSEDARAENLDALKTMSPDLFEALGSAELRSRASVRATTPDRMPIAGPVFHADTLRETLTPITKGAPVTDALSYNTQQCVLTGLGARGFTFAPLLAETLAAQAFGEPLPLSRKEYEQVSPTRFLIRALRKG